MSTQASNVTPAATPCPSVQPSANQILEDRYNNMAAGGAVTNQAASVAPASTNSGVANSTPAQSGPVFSANASPSVNDELEAKFAEMEDKGKKDSTPPTPNVDGRGKA